MLDNFNNVMKKNRPHLTRKDFLLIKAMHACTHLSSPWQWISFELFLILTYSPDRSPGDYFPFPNMEKCVGEKNILVMLSLLLKQTTILEKSYFWDDRKNRKLWAKLIKIKKILCWKIKEILYLKMCFSCQRQVLIMQPL